MAKHKHQGKKNKKGHKKGDKIHGIKKGKKGEAATYLTRAQALARLQVSLADFRRLCILKGIYPRDPKRKAHGNDKTYYHKKDILFLAHEPLMNKFLEMKTFMKKFKRLMGRKEHSLASSMEDRRPEYTVHHLVRERYPAFEDAIRDMDDCVSMLALFQSLPADKTREIPAIDVNEATRIYQEFQLYIIRSRCLRKVFASIKGYYFQAEIAGQPVTWLAPHQFAQDLPVEVDFRVMLTFLDFYRAMGKFVNFKLYRDLGLSYPPTRDEKKFAGAAEVASLNLSNADEVEMAQVSKERKQQGIDDEEDAAVAAAVAADFGEDSAEALEVQKKAAAAAKQKSTFRNLKIYVNREVPLRPVYFTLLCGGADLVGFERGAQVPGGAGLGSALSANSEGITHQIIDRPIDPSKMKEGREYVQPQWVFDSFNTGVLLPVAPYAPGRAPPPHLSPFVDDSAEGYVPRQREILDRLATEAAGGEVATVTDAEGKKTIQVKKTDNYEKFVDDLRAESKGAWHSEAKNDKAAEDMMADVDEEEDSPEDDVVVPAKPTEAEEERLRAKALMPKKHKRLLQRIENADKKKTDGNERLVQKRKKIAKK